MRLDQYSNPIFNSQDIFNSLYQGNLECLSEIFVDADPEIKKFEHATKILLNDFPPEIWSIEKNDAHNQAHWFMPDSYKSFDICKWVYDQCTTDEQLLRVHEELEEFLARDMLNLLRWLKYFVDTCTDKNIVWGVGRGSSVSSYVLYLLGVHQIDSIKYNLDWSEFLR